MNILERQRKTQEARKLLKETEKKLEETRRMLQEDEVHAQKTGRKLQVLMNAVCCKEPSSPQPICSNATTPTSQQTISTQRQLQWQQFQSKFLTV